MLDVGCISSSCLSAWAPLPLSPPWLCRKSGVTADSWRSKIWTNQVLWAESRPFQCWPILVLHKKNLGGFKMLRVLQPIHRASEATGLGCGLGTSWESNVRPRMRVTGLVRIALGKTIRCRTFILGVLVPQLLLSLFHCLLDPLLYPTLLAPALKVFLNKVLGDEDLRG